MVRADEVVLTGFAFCVVTIIALPLPLAMPGSGKCAELRRIALFCSLLCRIGPYRPALFRIAQPCFVLYRSAPHCTARRDAMIRRREPVFFVKYFDIVS